MSSDPTRITPEMVEDWRRIEQAATAWEQHRCFMPKKADERFIGEIRTALPLLIAEWERQREEIEKLKQECCRRSDKVRRMRKEARDYKKWKDFNTFMELRETIEKLTPPEVPGHKLTVSIEAMAPGAVHSVCGKGKTVAEAVASLREMVGKKEAGHE